MDLVGWANINKMDLTKEEYKTLCTEAGVDNEHFENIWRRIGRK